jgi:hypothetical protein
VRVTQNRKGVNTVRDNLPIRARLAIEIEKVLFGQSSGRQPGPDVLCEVGELLVGNVLVIRELKIFPLNPIVRKKAADEFERARVRRPSSSLLSPCP